eukprot:gene33925-43836_t
MQLTSREVRLLNALSELFDLPENSKPWEILVGLAESRGAAVNNDGTLNAEPSAKRAKHDAAVTGVRASEDSTEEMIDDDAEQQQLPPYIPLLLKDARSANEVMDGHKLVDAGDHEAFFEWMISPCDSARFFEEVWDDHPMLISRPKNRKFFQGWFSKDHIDSLLKETKLEYGTNIDVVNYKRGVRSTHNSNKDGSNHIADRDSVWDNFDNGDCSLRVLHPQRWVQSVWKLIAMLEKRFQCCVGCNCYLTPKGSQGFSPHYDDIDAFVLQLEGSKRWRLYKPREPGEHLVRFSSGDFTQEEVGEPIVDVVLHPGDIMYMPRGCIHQAVSCPDQHSLHITISAFQRCTWADFLQGCHMALKGVKGQGEVRGCHMALKGVKGQGK